MSSSKQDEKKRPLTSAHPIHKPIIFLQAIGRSMLASNVFRKQRLLQLSLYKNRQCLSTPA